MCHRPHVKSRCRRASSSLARWALLALAACACDGGNERTCQVSGVSSAIVDGTKASASQLLATVAILDRDGEAVCTGTLLTPDVVLTAAHCVSILESETSLVVLEPAAFRVSAGAPNLAVEDARAQVSDVRELLVHPDYLRERDEDAAGLGERADLALLALTHPISALSTARVMEPETFAKYVAPGARLTIEGYGAHDAAETAYDQAYFAETPFLRSNGREFLAGGPGEPDTCAGDSGGPAYFQHERTLWLVGVVSRGVPGHEGCGAGGVYTWVPAYDAWLEEGVDQLSRVNSVCRDE